MTKAVLLAGGKGLRLRPLTFEMAKAMIPVHSRPLMDNAIDLFFKYKAYEIWMSLGWKQQQIRDKYQFPFWIDAHTETGKIVSLGTGGWLNRLTKADHSDWNSSFYVCNVDNLFDVNLNEMLSLHEKKKYVVTIACTKVPDVREYGSVHINGTSIASFEEKKRSRVKKSGWINGGYYIFSPEIFKYVEELNIDINDPLSLENDLFPVLAKKGLLGGYKSNGQWFDTGTFERWEKVLNEWRGISDES